VGFRKERAVETRDVFLQLKHHFRPGQFNREAIFNFILEDERWTVSLGPDHCDIHEDRHSELADCTLEMPKEIFIGSFNGTYRPSIMDLLNGKIKVNRPEMLLAFKDLFGAI
jgi:hypothetical protein